MSDEQEAELERIRSWACCLEPERRFMAEVKVAQLEAENEALRECALEAYRIHNEAHLQADHYAYDLMRTVLRPLEDKKGLYPMVDALLKESE